MSEILCAEPLERGTEFIQVPPSGQRIFGACGPRALASAASSALGETVTCLGVYQVMRQYGWCDPSGASTIGALQDAAKEAGCKVADFRDYAEPWPDWQAWFEAQMAAQRPTVIEFANGQALVDYISGLGENAVNLRYHFGGGLGRNTGGWSPLANRTLPPGFWFADGDNFAGGNDNAHNFEAANVLQFYPDTVLAAAQPCAGLALVGRQTAMAWTKQADGTGKDDKGHVCGTGFMGELEAANALSIDGLMSETYLPDKTSFLPLADGDVFTWDGQVVRTSQGAQVAVKVYELYQEALKNSGGIPMQFQLARTAVDALSAAQKAGA